MSSLFREPRLQSYLVIDPIVDRLRLSYAHAKSLLAKHCIHLDVRQDLPASRDHDAYSAIILSDPIELDWHVQTPFLGMRTLNRLQRLQIAEQCGVRTVPWVPAELTKEALGKVLKFDWSYGRRGVFLLDETNIQQLMQRVDPSRDILMDYVSGDPTTFKVDVACGVVLGCWALRTHPIESSLFRSTGTPFHEWDADPKTLTAISALSKRLIEEGVFLSSVDLMRVAGDFCAIEVNSCSVGRATSWTLAPEQFGVQFAKAVLALQKNYNCLPSIEQLREKIINSIPKAN